MSSPDRPVRRATLASLAFTALLLVSCQGPNAQPAKSHDGRLDWHAVANVQVIEILTVDEDGDRRETKVWFVLIDGIPYLRTSDSSWLDNIRRDPNVVIRIEGAGHAQVAREATTPGLIEQVDAASRAKYGWQDGFIRFFRVGDPQILELSGPGS